MWKSRKQVGIEFMNLSLNQEFTPWKLLKFSAPSIVMMMFMSLYTIIDGMFVSRFVGSNALSSVNIVYPIMNIVVAIATMLATGGNAIISKYLGEGKEKEAKECLTMFVVIGLVISVLILFLTVCFTDQICYFLGSTDELLADCRSYLTILVLFAPACMLQSLFQCYLVTAERPNLGLGLIIVAGVLNMVLDYIFIVYCNMGIGGAALATGLGQSVPAVAGVLFFSLNKKGLHFTRFRIQLRELGRACYNGSSEMVSQLAAAIITFLFNMVMMRLAGANGVAAITIILYGEFLFNAFQLGFSIGIAPIIGFQYGAKNKAALKKIYRTTFIFVIVSSIVMAVAATVLARPIVTIFTQDQTTWELASAGFQIFAINFLFSGFNIASSGFFTALSNGKVSALISFCRTLLFTVIFLLVLPRIFGLNGAWIAIPASELCTLVLSIIMHGKYFIRKGKKNYLLA